MFGKAQKTSLPALPNAYDSIDKDAARLDREKRDSDMKKSFDADAAILPRMNVGDSVVMQDITSKKWNREGKIKEIVGRVTPT